MKEQKWKYKVPELEIYFIEIIFIKILELES